MSWIGPWRERFTTGEPTPGPLQGVRVAVKDVFAVSGQRCGAGVPAYLAGAAPAEVSAAAVQRLAAAGAVITGAAHTDQFAYSIAGTNEHFGTPRNPAVPGALPGGSTSGPATAVSSGEADLGLGTDTAGSIRVPASYQGLWGLRSTHGSVPTDGLMALAPSFDTVGLLTRDSELLGASAAVLVPDALGLLGRLVVDPAVIGLAATTVAEVVGEKAGQLRTRLVDLGSVAPLYAAFRIRQAFEAWQTHGAWITAHPGAVIGAAGERFRQASLISGVDNDAAGRDLDLARRRLDEVLGDDVLLLPAASSAAPQADAPAAEIDRIRAATLTLTCLAGITGRPAVSIPGLRTPAGPVGWCLIGPRGSDRSLVRLAGELDAANREA